MKVVYTSPNRSHHYRYASMLNKAGILHKFISGFSRWSPRAGLDEVGSKLVRRDVLQTLYLLALKLHAPAFISRQLAYLAKIEQDNGCKKYMKDADIFIYYNGSGLNASKKAREKGAIVIVEAVNSHVHYQETLLSKEYEMLNLPWQPFHSKEKARRLAEYKIADYILMPSNFVKRSFIEMGFSAEKLLQVPYGFNRLIDHAHAYVPDSGTFDILYVGSISVRKGLRYLIEAFQKLNHPAKRLILVGPENIPNGLHDIEIPEGVEFTGVLKGADLEAAYRKATVFCLPSIEEGLALVLGEALSYGLPIIATENTGADDIITDGEEGFIVPIRQSGMIAEKLQLLADDKSFYHEMRSKAIAKAESLNGWEETGRLLVAALEKVYNAKLNKR